MPRDLALAAQEPTPAPYGDMSLEEIVRLKLTRVLPPDRRRRAVGPLRADHRARRAAADRAHPRAHRRQPAAGRRHPRHQPQHAAQEDHRRSASTSAPRRRAGVMAAFALPARSTPIVDPLDTGRRPVALAAALLAGGARLLQLRAEDAPHRASCSRVARAVRDARRAPPARAASSTTAPTSPALVGADGVHLGQDDLPLAAARALLGPDARRSASRPTTLAQARRRAARRRRLPRLRPDLRHHEQGATPIRRRASPRCAPCAPRCPLPLVAIGGITARHAADGARRRRRRRRR